MNWASSNGGTVSTINQAFKITLNSYLETATKQTFFSPNQEPTLDLAVRLFAITGLTQTNPPSIGERVPIVVKIPASPEGEISS